MKPCYFKDFAILVLINTRETRFGIIGKFEPIKICPVSFAEVFKVRAEHIYQLLCCDFYLLRNGHVANIVI